MMMYCQARADNPTNTVEVHAAGVVTVPSDTIVLPLSISTSHNDVQEAKKRNDQIAEQIFRLADAQHVNRPALLKTGLSFDFGADQDEDGKAQYNQKAKGGKKGVQDALPGSKEPPIHMTRDIEVKFHNLNQAIGLLAEMTKWDSVRTTFELRLGELTFDVADREKHLMKARRLAVASARENAQLLADQNGLKLGRATLIYDDSPSSTVHGLIDPFGAALSPEPQGNSPAIRLVAMQQVPPAKLDMDQIPPAQVAIAASVRIVFEVTKH
jgi:uncharacterized protein YggE